MGWTYGIHAVEALLRESPDQIQELWFVRSRRPGAARERLREVAETEKVRFRMVDDRQLARAVGDVAHQGVAARSVEFEYTDESALLAVEGPSLVVVLDEVQDPHNLGAVIRTAAAFGATGVVIPRHRSATVTSTVRKVAVGAEHRVSIAQASNMARFLVDARDAGYWCYGLTGSGDTMLSSSDLSDRAVLVLGSEGRGVRPNVLDKCDVQVCIPIGEVESLNVSVAAGVAMWEWRRARA